MRSDNEQKTVRGDFYPTFRGCLYKNWVGIKTGSGDFHPAFMKKIRRENFLRHNAKILFFKNNAYKCKQRTQKLIDKGIEYNNSIFYGLK